MVDTGIFATTAEVQRKVGANASATANVEAYINQFMTEAESYINVSTGVNYSDTYTTLNVDVKGILKKASSSFAAASVINYDSSGFSRILESQDRKNYLIFEFDECIKLLTPKKGTDFISGA